MTPLLATASIPNLRDAGGQRTADGRRVRRGLLFRSANLAGLAEGAGAELDRLRLRTLVDLRTDAERRRHPTDWPGEGVARQTSSRADTAELLGAVMDSRATTEREWRDAFSGFYERLPLRYAAEYRAMFQALAAGAVPILIHCSAGKDRTGVAIALVLSLLGVPRDDIVTDYLLSREGLRDNPAFTRMLTGGAMHGFAALSPEGRATLLGVQAEHLDAALAATAREFGSVEGYVVAHLGLTAADVAAIREHLLDD